MRELGISHFFKGRKDALTSVTKRLCDSFFLAFMILTMAASILSRAVKKYFLFAFCMPLPTNLNIYTQHRPLAHT